jgi:hypothetical protein
MWRITGDEKYREWGWEMFQSFVKWTALEDGTGFSSVSDVMKTPPPTRDNMESFWLVSLSVANDSKIDKQRANLNSHRPKHSNTSTFSSPQTTTSHSQMSSSTPKPTLSLASK